MAPRRAHAAIGFVGAALIQEGLAGRLVGAGEQAADHDASPHPAPIALTMSPEVRTPPSAMEGTAWSRQAARGLASRRRIAARRRRRRRGWCRSLPGPIPILTAVGARLDQGASAPSGVATLPAMIWTALERLLDAGDGGRGRPALWPWAVSTTTTSTPASIRAVRAGKAVRRPTPVAAATRRRPSSSLLASGWVPWPCPCPSP